MWLEKFSVCAEKLKRDYNATRLRLVSGEAIIVNKEETGSLKERRDC